ncbi:FG-GAP-like repeat-containing protein [Seonamhaeicola maritimus]|uniref:FG-GAP-like repeat-containing protein n=1 Tax=Seonamhaeicola maritimus TaxID=2591822 RepID=UPI002495942B|nr:FG-GAP-like repeat-containing protein [Seonamhaeicola maritimus]
MFEFKLNNLIPLFCLVTLLLTFSCEEQDAHKEGRELAKIHCSTCHLYPEPLILPRRVWGEKIMPNMGLKMGMSHGPLYSYGKPEELKDLTPSLSQEDWNKIVHYYINSSENEPPIYQSIQNQKENPFFNPRFFSNHSIPLVTMTSFNLKDNKLYLGESNTNSLLTLDQNGQILNSDKFDSPPVKIMFTDSINYVLTIGSLAPSDEAKGKLYIGRDTIEGLRRPVDFLVKDVNSDGFNDIYICNYGNSIGDFSWYENLKDGTYKKREIYPLSGAIKIEIANIDTDSEEEIIVLFAQEHESVFIFDSTDSSFDVQKVAQFQPTFGSVDFQLRDMDNDGDLDIIIGNGDNSDFSLVLKQFHGVRILINEGNKVFTESYFQHIHGVSKIQVEDFDIDGDMDIVAISNFGNFTDPKFKSVNVLINEGDLEFTPQYIKNLPEFRWQTIDVSDYDQDGDQDVFLGSFNLNIGPEESDVSDKQNITWVKLENTTL